MPYIANLISDVLSLPDDALVYEASRRLHDLFPDKFILETEDYDFQLAEYAAAGRCMVHLLDDAFGHFEAKWLSSDEGAAFEPRNGYFEIHWRGTRLHCLSITYSCTLRHYIIADRRHDALEFFSAVCSLEVDAKGELLVFRNGWWWRDPELKRQISGASLDKIVMPAGVKEDLVADVERFFAAEDLYREHGLAWKRGLLLLGNPGNGKTQTIQALVNHLGKPGLYVRSFVCEKRTVHRSIGNVFEKAREVAPCILVLEDIDSLVEKEDISFLLNEMDGFAKNHGVLTIATTNHPEKLDPALLNRPSRFDRKIEFKDPEMPERLKFLQSSNRQRHKEMRLSLAHLRKVAERTDGFSYAYLKELDLAAMTASLIGGKQMAEAMEEALGKLAEQVRKAQEVEEGG